MSVHQEEIYMINLQIEDEDVGRVKDYLNCYQPVCTEVDWFQNDSTITNFDSKYYAEQFEKELLVSLENTK